MLDQLKSALAVFVMFVGLTIAGVIGIGFAMTCFALVTRAQGLLPDAPTSEAARGSLSPLHAVTLAPSRGDHNKRPMVVVVGSG
jgi:hypothetical protein